MAKFYDVIGYSEESQEISPGVYDDVIVERKYYGDIRKESLSQTISDEILPGIRLNNIVSIVADPYAINHIYNMRYIRIYGTYWTISSVENDPDRPRLTIRPGGVYNGPKASAPDDSGDDSGNP